MRTRTRGRAHVRAAPPHRPASFEAGVIAEPLLAFGGGHEHVDPKTGLSLYGPYSLSDQRRPSLASIRVGIVGTPGMISDAQQWLRFCTNVVTNDGHEPFQWPHFPGFNAGHPFQCELVLGDALWEDIRDDELKTALGETNFFERIKRVVALYAAKLEVLAGRGDARPDLIICCIPQNVIDFCAVRMTRGGRLERRKVTPAERAAQAAAALGQEFLFSSMDPRLGIEGESGVHENLRRGIKAEAMRFGIPTQLVWPRTLALTDSTGPARTVQDRATRAWNLMTALYHKAGGSPWRLAQIEPGTCFVGVSFYKELGVGNGQLRTSLAQAFTTAGDGYVLRGRSFEWDERRQGGASPHLDSALAAALLRDVLDLYQKQNRGALPTRVVVHKSSRFWEDELSGFQDACEYIPRRDFVALGWRGLQFYRTGDYPPLRGTYVKFDDNDLLLYTSGYVPYLRTYPGPRAPQPIEILERYGDSPWDLVLREIQALTKMNWNTANFASAEPITIAFSRRVGQILAELPATVAPRAEYRFYM